MNVEEIQEILTKTLKQVSDREISIKRANVISRIALSLSKNIEHVDLKKRVELLESILKKRR